jgi:hypothetical protein
VRLDDPLARVRPASNSSDSAASRLLLLAVAAVFVAAAVLRFVTRSPLWLDEALTVNIASHPVSQLPTLLRRDGAPPLFYVMLHFWMQVFGTGSVATRALSGVIGLVNLPVAWLAGFRVGARWWDLDDADPETRREREVRGRITAWAVTLLLAVSPFAVYYDTEVRMYALVLLLGTLGVLAVCSILRRPSWRTALALAIVTAAALYSHYWSLYMTAVVGAGALWCVLRGPRRLEARYVLGALVAGGLAFVPWLPTFLYQAKHTGTPWSTPAQFTDIVTSFTQLAGGTSTAARGLTLVFFFLLVLALFGTAYDRRHVMLDLRTTPGVRPVAGAAIATLVLAIVAARLQGSAFADRYTAIAAFPMLLGVAYGLSAVANRRIRLGILAVAVVLGFAASSTNMTYLRTQAGQASASINAGARPGDVIGYCPDQLGPSVSRLVTKQLGQFTFPRGTGPKLVNWVDYRAAIKQATPYRFAQLLEQEARGHAIWYVWSPTYTGFGNDCIDVALDLGSKHQVQHVVALKTTPGALEVFEGMLVYRYSPR